MLSQPIPSIDDLLQARILVGVRAVGVVDDGEASRGTEALALLDEGRKAVSVSGVPHLLERRLRLVLRVHVDAGEQQVPVRLLDALELQQPGVRLAGSPGADVLEKCARRG